MGEGRSEWQREGSGEGARPWQPLVPLSPSPSPPQSSQKKSCVEEPEPKADAAEGDGDKKGNAEGSSDEEGKLVIDEPTKEKNEKGALKRRAGDLLEVTARCLGPRRGQGSQSEERSYCFFRECPVREPDGAPSLGESLAEKMGHRRDI